jgi:hypothetical protein
VTLQEGIYPNVPESVYHADPAPEPSLSSSIARMIVHRSPLHAWTAHPRLNPEWRPRTPRDAMDDGSALHKLILREGPDIVEIDAEDRRKNDTKAAIAAAREAGHIPILRPRLAELHRCAEAVLDQSRSHPDLAGLFGPGHAEATMIWQEGAAWCRARVDWLPEATGLPAIDLKSTGMSAAPAEWERRLITEYAIQCAFYERGLTKLRPSAGRDPMVFLVFEQEEPYAISTIAPAPSLLELAMADVEEAIARWQECLATGEWPGYPPYTAYVEAPGWALMRLEERGMRREFDARQRLSAAIMEGRGHEL